ncbi:ERGIC-53 protein [Sarcoptes scabiei]|nr:ERGIC-53 protein [Sarcoptes scabiei]
MLNSYSNFWSLSRFDQSFRLIGATLCVALILTTLIGNILVIIVVVRFHRMRTVTNILLASLAVADITVASLVMPFTVVYDIYRYWPWGPVLCHFWISCDVMCCTASILHLCCVAIDRFWAITRPLRYRSLISKRRLFCCIISIWLCSAAISFIPIFSGWYHSQGHINVFTMEYIDKCGLDVNRIYAVVSSSTSFYLPLPIMFYVYFRILLVAERQSREIKQLEQSLRQNGFISSNSNSTLLAPPPPPPPSSSSSSSSPPMKNKKKSKIKKKEPKEKIKNRISSIRIDHCNYNSPNGNGGENNNIPIESRSSETNRAQNNNNNNNNNLKNNCQKIRFTFDSKIETLSSTNDEDNDYDYHQSSMSSHNCSDLGNLHQRDKPKISLKFSNLDDEDDEKYDADRQCKMIVNDESNTSEMQFATMKQTEDSLENKSHAERSLRRRARQLITDTKAIRTLGIVMGVFCLCWLPFFIMYVIAAYCIDCNISYELRSSITWLGYVNSALNPAIYAYLNKDFKMAFKKVIFCMPKGHFEGFERDMMLDDYPGGGGGTNVLASKSQESQKNHSKPISADRSPSTPGYFTKTSSMKAETSDFFLNHS